jgi:uncharacterized protein YndB with AHSA1/START domain
MAERGFIDIADITGYTAFLSGSELDHAQDSLRGLLMLLVEHTRPPLVISRLEGDAVIAYAPSGSFLQGQTLVELIENCYVAFRQARERMQLNTSCTCNACLNIPNLDLKFLVHFGSYVLQDMLTYRELVGSDVNLAHRLLKNHIREATGIAAYAAYTTAAAEALGIQELCLAMRPHRESYEHLGEVGLYVQDLHPVWERERDRRRVLVDPAEALVTIELDYPAPPPLVWDYFTKPEYRTIVNASDGTELGQLQSGRKTEGSVFYCAHGEAKIAQTVLDWRPFEYFTYNSLTPVEGVTMLITERFLPIEGGTRAQVICARAAGPEPGRGMVDQHIGSPEFRQACLEAAERLRELIVRQLEQGAVVLPELVAVTPEAVSSAARASLGR